MLYCNNPSLEMCVGECNCSSTEFTEGDFWQQVSTRLFCAFRVSLLVFVYFFPCFFFLLSFLFLIFEKKKTQTGWLRIWSLTHCMYCFLKFIYFNFNAQRFSPNLGRLVSPKLCEIALAKKYIMIKTNKKNHTYDIYILIEMSAERNYLMHWLWV